MHLDKTYGLLNLLEFKCNCFNHLFLAEYEFKIQMLAGKEANSFFEMSHKDLPPLVYQKISIYSLFS